MEENTTATSGETQETPPVSVKRNVKDSVFTHLFKIKRYARQLYRALCPDGPAVTESQIEIVTLVNVLLNQIYNDLALLVGDTALILVEAQSTWSVNIVVRLLLYAAETLHRYILQTKQNMYSGKPLKIPKMKFFVIYTGNRKNVPEELVLSKTFFGGEECSVDVRAKVIRDGKQGDIINQYVTFTRIYQEQYRKYGQEKQAIMETIRICQQQNVLKKYLEDRKEEVIDIMMSLFDQQTALDIYIDDIRKESREEGIKKGIKKGREEGREEGIAATVETCKEFGLNLMQTIAHLKKVMPFLSAQEAETQVKAIW